MPKPIGRCSLQYSSFFATSLASDVDFSINTIHSVPSSDMYFEALTGPPDSCSFSIDSSALTRHASS